mmetsp:Transcript_123832/g.361567  ORF Transcript_123832/g.361567 Transcript_123832/m.361567 type:complete len:205 (+) Transcript_123832:286-900(+)
MQRLPSSSTRCARWINGRQITTSLRGFGHRTFSRRMQQKPTSLWSLSSLSVISTTWHTTMCQRWETGLVNYCANWSCNPNGMLGRSDIYSSSCLVVAPRSCRRGWHPWGMLSLSVPKVTGKQTISDMVTTLLYLASRLCQRLMERCRRLYWPACVGTCIRRLEILRAGHSFCPTYCGIRSRRSSVARTAALRAIPSGLRFTLRS